MPALVVRSQLAVLLADHRCGTRGGWARLLEWSGAAPCSHNGACRRWPPEQSGQAAAAGSRQPCKATRHNRAILQGGGTARPGAEPPAPCPRHPPDLRSAPMMMRSLAYSRSAMSTALCQGVAQVRCQTHAQRSGAAQPDSSCQQALKGRPPCPLSPAQGDSLAGPHLWPSRAALSAATLTRLAKSAPLKPGVPLAMVCVVMMGRGRVWEHRSAVPCSCRSLEAAAVCKLPP